MNLHKVPLLGLSYIYYACTSYRSTSEIYPQLIILPSYPGKKGYGIKMFNNTNDKACNLNFRGGNPGAVQYGNFINYYKFHPPKDRIDMLPKDIWIKKDPFICLDIGCNAGDLTFSLFNFLMNTVNKSCYILAIDIDPILVKRATENNTNTNITFVCLDFMNAERRKLVFTEFLNSIGANKFSATFCFSVTMWIHLNYGDEGLSYFLNEICDISNMVIIEPQPWKCYKSAVKRMKSCNEEFKEYKHLKIRNKVDEKIEQILIEINGVTKIRDTVNTSWGRKILIFRIT